MEPNNVEQLKAAGELVDQAAKQVHEAAVQPAFLSEAARQAVRDQVKRIGLQLMFLRRDLTILKAAANHRSARPRKNSDQ